MHPGGHGPTTGAWLLVAAVLALLVLGCWWFWTRPVTAMIAVLNAPDATIVSCDRTGTGTLGLSDLRPGVYPVTIQRVGYAPLNTDIVVKRFGANRLDVALDALPWTLRVTAPEGAACRVTDGSGAQVATGTGSIDTHLGAGRYVVEVSSAGKNPYRRELFLDQDTALTVRLDAEGQLVHSLGIIPCAGAPKGVVVTPNGREAWATILNGPPSIEIFDVATLARLGGIDIGEYGAVEIVFSADGSRAYASQMETAKVFEIDTATRTVLRELPTESAWTKVVSLSPDGATLFAANWSGDDVSEIDLASGKVRRRIRTADTPRGLWQTPDGKTLYVAGFEGGELQRIDLASGEVTTVFDSGGALRHLVADAGRGMLFASDMSKDVVWVHELATGTTRTFCETDEKPNTIDLSPDGKVLFVSCRGENNPKSYYIPGFEWGTILLIDTTDGTPLDAIIGGNQCTALDVSDDGKTLVFSDFLDDRLQVYEIPDYDTLTSGGGGRWEQHFTDLRK
ncbi:MAG: hypothetical protein CVT60_04265 [Actinobacteria bacterium HGW-Actinobacteria-10]|nr:MAG: hypothetical protein CVT60_04265 [Actinobacteria bacterium HGW-Actinobacteria-10]